MFDKKLTALFPTKAKASKGPTVVSKKSAFVDAGLQRKARTLSGNGALKYNSTGKPFVDEFGTAGSFKKPRTYQEVANSMNLLWAEDPITCVRFALYLRIITRQVVFPDGSKTEHVQRGQGLKHEGIFRAIWLAVNHPKVFWRNFHLFVSVGGWKDIITMLSYDLVYNNWAGRKLDWDLMGQMILAALENPKTSNLVKKYLPQLKANSACTTPESQADNMIAKWICSLLFGGKVDSNTAGNYKKYRKYKTSGTAHEWQQLISRKQINNLDFSTVHGRALALLVSSKFIKNNGLETKYTKWVESQPTVKYTGYVYELLATINPSLTGYKKETVIKQFAQLVETAKKGAKAETSLIVVRDTSGSMSSAASGTKISCGNIAKGLALFFSEMLPAGHFSDSWIEFNSDAKMHKWKGANVVDRWNNDHAGFVGGTDFQSVIRLFCNIKRNGISENEFPTGILCISDGEFNPTQLGVTNVQQALISLKDAGFSQKYVENFQIILWNLQSGYYGANTGKKFETYGNVKNVFYFSGLDGSVVSFLTGMEGKTQKPPETAEELFTAAMDQEVLNLVEL